MKPYDTLQNLDRTINNIKYQLKYSKNKNESESILKDLLKVRNEFNTFINDNLQADVLETLILDLILTKIKLESKLGENHIYDLNLYLGQLGEIIKEGKDLKASELISYLKQPYNVMIEKDFEANQDMERVQRMMAKIPKTDRFLNILQEFVDILKTDINTKKYDY